MDYVSCPAEWAGELAERWEALAEELRRRLGPGTPLDLAARAGYEERLGRQLVDARVHRGPLAGRLAQALGAEALSVGGHVLGGGQGLDPATPAGGALLGHELVHAAVATGSPALRQTSARAVQREVASEGAAAEQAHEEAQAHAVEVAIRREAGGEKPGREPVEVEALAERVYQRIVELLLLERERAAGVR